MGEEGAFLEAGNVSKGRRWEKDLTKGDRSNSKLESENLVRPTDNDREIVVGEIRGLDRDGGDRAESETEEVSSIASLDMRTKEQKEKDRLEQIEREKETEGAYA